MSIAEVIDLLRAERRQLESDLVVCDELDADGIVGALPDMDFLFEREQQRVCVVIADLCRRLELASQ